VPAIPSIACRFQDAIIMWRTAVLRGQFCQRQVAPDRLQRTLALKSAL
jgi:hypothetical protein